MLPLLLACTPAPFAVLATHDDGPLETTPAVKARDGGYSVTFGERSVWTYGDSILSLSGEDGSSWRDNTFSWTLDRDASDGVSGFTEPVDALGAPMELFPETADEAAYNAAHRGDPCEEPCGAREILWPMDAVEDQDRVLLFYDKIHGEPGEWNFFSRGYGVAVWEDPDSAPTRPEARPGQDEPTLLFTRPTDNYGMSALLLDQLYAYACEGEDGWDKPCRVARVPPQEVLDPAAWRFWDGAAWQADREVAAELFQGASQMTVRWNEALGAYLAVYMEGASGVVYGRVAPAPEGPWSDKVKLFKAEDAQSGFPYSAVHHPEFDDGGTILVTYYRGTGDWTGEIRAVRVELGPSP